MVVNKIKNFKDNINNIKLAVFLLEHGRKKTQCYGSFVE